MELTIFESFPKKAQQKVTAKMPERTIALPEPVNKSV